MESNVASESPRLVQTARRDARPRRIERQRLGEDVHVLRTPVHRVRVDNQRRD